MGNPDYDEFDLIVSIAFGATPQTRQMRSSRVKRGQFLDKYQGVAREVLERLLDIYAQEGVCEVDFRRLSRVLVDLLPMMKQLKLWKKNFTCH